MSLAIDTDKIFAVMIGGEWHYVKDGSFCLDSYEFGYFPKSDPGNFFLEHGGGGSDVCAIGFQFLISQSSFPDRKDFMCGPLTSIQAVQWKDQ